MRTWSRIVASLCVLCTCPLPAQERRVDTDRESKVVLPLPKGDDMYTFVVLGDRTGGPAEGIRVLAKAIEEINLLDPDLVMTVGDLVNGYNETPAWIGQMREYRATMEKLRMPWFPVAGNHDIYGPSRNGSMTQDHEKEYEEHFGPLWYAFEHKQCWFVALYSDEGNPGTGKKSISDPASQVMSERQFTWLKATLEKAKGGKHVFLFLHHPRWLTGQYGEDWNRVHDLLKGAGNVRAVFAGHIHRMRYDGRRDGIEYFTTAANGAYLDIEVPKAGFLHEYHIVTVRKEGISLAALPVGVVIDPRAITGEISLAAQAIAKSFQPVVVKAPRLGADLACSGTYELLLENPCDRPLELTLEPRAKDPRWSYFPDHVHLRLEARQKQSVGFEVQREAGLDRWFDLPVLGVSIDYLAEGARITMPERIEAFAIGAPARIPDAVDDRALVLDGKRQAVRLDDKTLELPDGPFTAEGFLQADDLTGRRGFLNKTEQSEFGLFVSDGKPSFVVYLGDRYASATAKEPLLEKGRWHHLAGVFDGQEVRLYVDGNRVAATPGKGERKRNALPLFVGADVDKAGKPTSFFAGRIDEVRVSKSARYAGASFTPSRRFDPDGDTVVLLHCDREFGPWLPDASGQGRHGMRVGGVVCAPKDGKANGR